MRQQRQPCVYILASRFNGTPYVGVTSGLIGRVMQHRDGTFDGFTGRYGAFRLVWFGMAETMDAAIATEKRIKKWPRQYKLNLIERDNPDWNDLAPGLGLAPLPRQDRHPGLVPGSTGPHTCQPAATLHCGCRDEPGMTEKSKAP